MIPHLDSAKGRKPSVANAAFNRVVAIGLTIVSIICCGIWLSSVKVSASQSSFQHLATLVPGETLRREFDAEAVHRFQVSLPANHYLRLSVEQRDVALISSLFDTRGQKLIEANYGGKERLSVIAPSNQGDPSIYQLEIRARFHSTQSGYYLLKIEERRPAISRDEDRVKAERLVAEASQLSRQGKEGLRHAVEMYRVALPLWRTQSAVNLPSSLPDSLADGGDRREEARTFYLMALSQQDLGDNQAALESYLRSLEISREESDAEREHLALSALGTLYFTLGDKRKAIDCYNAALRFSQAQGNRAIEAGVLVNLGIAHKALGESSKAQEFYQLALNASRVLGDQELEVTTLTNLARLCDLTGDKSSAANFYQQVLPVWQRLGNAGGEAVTLKNLGALLESTGQREQALGYYRRALAVNQATGDLAREAHIHGDLARVERDSGNFKVARDEIERALEYFDAQRRQLLNPELKASFAATNQRYFEFYIDLLMRLNDLNLADDEDFLATAFLVSESARMRALADLIAEAKMDWRVVISPELLERERDLGLELTIRKAERVALQRRKAAAAEVEAVEQQIVRLGVMHEQAQNELRRSNPRLASLIRPVPLSLTEVQRQLLDADSVLLEYSLGEERSYVWAIGQQRVQVAKLPGRKEIEAQGSKFYDLLTARSQTVKFETPAQKQRRVMMADRELPAAASDLSRTLLKPVASMLGQKRLLVVGDGVLNFIPFGALPEPVVGNRLSVGGKSLPVNRPPITDNRQPLLVNHEIVNLPSASVLAELRRESPLRPIPNKDLAVVADPVFTRLDDRLSNNPSLWLAEESANVMRSQSERDAEGLNRLHYSRREAVRIAEMVAPHRRLLALGFEANRSLVTDGLLSQYRYVHFATHGLLNSQSPELSGLVLSLLNDHGDSQLGVVRLGDIYKLNLSAELVVLSACRTGLGKEVRGEGLIGLTRGFMHAGVPRVISSLWSVDDAATAELMTRFYRELMVGKRTPAAALRAAQLSLRAEGQWQSPYFWSAFTLQGEPR
ncbi:MAG: CHAT domain-containing protein [Blastocatellia bacterium]